MAGGPIGPINLTPDTGGNVYPGVHIGGTNARPVEGISVVASLGADGDLTLVFEAPQVLPTGTAKLRCLALADATTGVAKINPAWASVAVGDTPDTITLNAEGTTTVTWATGDDDELLESKITLDADTIVAGELVYIVLTFETASWTLAQISTWLFSIIWE